MNSRQLENSGRSLLHKNPMQNGRRGSQKSKCKTRKSKARDRAPQSGGVKPPLQLPVSRVLRPWRHPDQVGTSSAAVTIAPRSWRTVESPVATANSKFKIQERTPRVAGPMSRIPCPVLQTFSSASSRSRMMSCQSSRPMDRRMPSGCIPKARFCASGRAEWVMDHGCSISVLICPRLTARVTQ